MILLIKSKNRKLDDKYIESKYGSLYKDLNYTKHYHLLYYYPITLFRKLAYAINFVAIHESPVAQLIICLVLSLSVRSI